MFSAHKDELIVDEIFVRIYNEQPTFTLAEPKHYTKALLNFIGTKAQVGSMVSRRTAHSDWACCSTYGRRTP